MNTSKLREIILRIIEVEEQLQTQDNLEALDNALASLVSQPGNTGFQDEVSDSLRRFSESMTEFKAAFSPRDFERVCELYEPAFSQALVEEINKSIAENALSPNVASEKVKGARGGRETAFDAITNLRDAFDFFEIGDDLMEIGSASVGFQIPRTLFDNDLDGLISELLDIKRVIQFFSEVSVGEYVPPKVGSISTTDPLFFFEMLPLTAKYLAGSVTWAIGVWFSVEKIRNIRAQTAQLQSFSAEEVQEIFDSKIKKEIDAAVETKVNQLLEQGNAKDAQKGELVGQLSWALNVLLAKIERGMTVELKIAPPPPTTDGEENDEEDVNSDETNEALIEIQSELIFPSANENPVMEIPEFKED